MKYTIEPAVVYVSNSFIVYFFKKEFLMGDIAYQNKDVASKTTSERLIMSLNSAVKTL